MTLTDIEDAQNKLKDKEWRMSHLYKIITKKQQLVTYKRNQAQASYAARKTNTNVILKARQLGFSTECLIDLLDTTITTPHTNSAIVAHDAKKVMVLFETVKRAYQNMPEEIKPKASYENRNELYFPDLDSKIYVTLDTRSETVHNLHWSEVAFTKDAHRKAAGIFASVPKGGRITLESTADGMAGYFYEEWSDGQSEFKHHFYNWLWDPQYTEPTTRTIAELEDDYRELAIRYSLIPDIASRFSLTPEQFAWYIKQVRLHKDLVVQEYPTTELEAFLAAGRNVFHIVDLNKHILKPAIDRKWGDTLIWEQPLKGFQYAIGVDVAEGLGGDNSVIEVFNAHTGEQAAEFVSNHVAPDKLADYIVELGNYYNKAYVVIEVNNHGRSVVDNIKRRYYNLYRREQFDKVTNTITEAIGWKTTQTTKPRLVDNLEQAVREQSVLVRSDSLMKEMRVFVQTDETGKQGFGAEGNAKDDRVIAAGLALQGIKNIPSQKKPRTIAEIKLKEYAKKHGLPSDFQDQQIESQALTRHNRPRVALRRN